MLFIIVGRPVVVFGGRTLVAVFERSPFGIKSKRIFLSADAAFNAAFKAVLQPVRTLPEGSFIVLCRVARLSCELLRKAIHSKKIC